ncbi:hypothetical protein [Caldimonas sp. KR1-144]|uniref:hypothetical protein n=1 Tax=Caldimonas sp. KR1-144 TaxID=3400911 RepID=UPI003BFC93F6
MTDNVHKALKSWRSLVSTLPSLTAEEVLAAIEREKNGKRRKTVLDRLARRMTRLSEIQASTFYKDLTHGNHCPQDDCDRSEG